MKKSILLFILIPLFSGVLKAQDKSKADTTISKKDIAILQRNMTAVQQQIHTFHLDAVLRDKLDSVYYVNMGIITPKPEEKKKKP